MNLQQAFLAVFIAAGVAAFGAAMIANYQRFRGRNYRKAALIFLCAWLVAAADGLLAWAQGYWS